MKGRNSSDCPIEVVLPESSGSSLVDRRQLDKVDGGAWCDGVVRVGFDLFSESKVFLELDRKVLCSMWSAPILFIPKSRGAWKAAQLVSAKKQIDFVRKEGGSIFEEPVVRLANLLKITDNSHNRNGNGSFSSHLSWVQKHRYLKIRSIPSATFIRSLIPEISRCMRLSRAI